MRVKLEVYPSEALSTVAKEVKSKTRARLLKKRLDAGKLILWSSPLGLASPQIGDKWRACYVGYTFMVNPEIVGHSKGKHISMEGCFSERGSQFAIERWDSVVVRYQDENLEQRTATLRLRGSDCAQHELDHLDGITIMDKGERNDELVR